MTCYSTVITWMYVKHNMRVQTVYWMLLHWMCYCQLTFSLLLKLVINARHLIGPPRLRTQQNDTRDTRKAMPSARLTDCPIWDYLLFMICMLQSPCGVAFLEPHQWQIFPTGIWQFSPTAGFLWAFVRGGDVNYCKSFFVRTSNLGRFELMKVERNSHVPGPRDRISQHLFVKELQAPTPSS